MAHDHRGGWTGAAEVPRQTNGAVRGGRAGSGVPRVRTASLQALGEILDAAPTKEALVGLPSNRFEALGGNRAGRYGIRINERWRICFEWPEGDPAPFNIEIVDYH